MLKLIIVLIVWIIMIIGIIAFVKGENANEYDKEELE
jgi:hypothetical protein